MEGIRVFDTGTVIAQMTDEAGAAQTFIIVAEVEVEDRTVCVGYRSDILSGPAELFEKFEAETGDVYFEPVEDEELYQEIEDKLWELESEDDDDADSR